MKYFHLVLSFLFLSTLGFAQGLEDVIVETYYISDANDATDSDGGILPAGTTTYRIYLDLAPNYKVETVYGSPVHELRIETTTLFFNNEDRGELSGNLIGDNRLDENTVALDSWVTIGAASESHFGVLKTDDPDGSIVGGANNDGGSTGIAEGLLANDDPTAGIPLTTADGLIGGTVPSVQLIADNASIFEVFDNVNDGPVFTTNNGAWAVLGGFVGPTVENRVLIAQITTNGELSFALNVRVNTVDGSGEPIDYVSGTPQGDEVFFPALIFPIIEVPGCASPTACNFDPLATADDGSCFEPETDCTECSGENLVLIDDDGDGVCNAEEIFGCTDPEALNFNLNATEDDGTCEFEGVGGCTDIGACNFNPEATADDGSCLIPEINCTECNEASDALILIDMDSDGVCDAAEIEGCENPEACNFDPIATDDDGSCIVPEQDCSACNSTNDGLDIIDADGDGICDAEEIAGCTDPVACNFDPSATDEAGSCLIPEVNCTECSGEDLILIDDDGDGVCNADEVSGCTDPDALNYDPSATDDDGSCEFLGVTDLSAAANLISIYPNPVQDVLTINQISSNLNLSLAQLRIFDILGNKMHEETLNLNGPGAKQLIQFPPSSEGLYLIEISTDEERYLLRVVKN
jgi:hypothetical protein